MIVSLAVLYNIIFVSGRAVFWELNNRVPGLWWTLDYLCDFIYILDTIVRMHEGKQYKRQEIPRNIKIKVAKCKLYFNFGILKHLHMKVRNASIVVKIGAL